MTAEIRWRLSWLLDDAYRPPFGIQHHYAELPGIRYPLQEKLGVGPCLAKLLDVPLDAAAYEVVAKEKHKG